MNTNCKSTFHLFRADLGVCIVYKMPVLVESLTGALRDFGSHYIYKKGLGIINGIFILLSVNALALISVIILYNSGALI